MNEIKIITELCPEDRDRIDRLTGVMEALAEQVAKSTKTPAEAPAEATGAAKAGTPATDHPAEESLPWGDPAPVEEPKPVVTTADVQQKVIKLVNAGKKPEVLTIVKSYAANVSSVPEDRLAECLERLNALEVGA